MPNRHNGARRAFALIATLILAATLVTLAIGAAALLTLARASEYQALRQARLRLAAHAALRIALGEMQTSLGPDRRATAALGLRDDVPPGRRHTAAVWRADRLAHESPEAPPFHFRDAAGALRDRRTSSDRLAAPWRILDSGDPTGAPAARLVDPEESDEPVTAAYTPLTGDLRVAWWVGDQGVKAMHGLPRPEPRDGKVSLAPPPRPATRAELDGLPDPEAPLAFADDTARRRTFHHVAEHTHGVLANSRDGGLRRDLTPFLLGDGALRTPGGRYDDAPLIDEADAPYRTFGPRFGVLRTAAQAGAREELAPTTGHRFVRRSVPTPADTFHDGTHADLPDIARRAIAPYAPVLTDAAVYHRLGYDASRVRTDGAPVLRLHLYPRVALWNPYDRPMAPATYLVHLRAGGSPEFRLTPSNKIVIGRLTGWRIYRNDEVNYATTQGSLTFLVSCPRLAPGESVLFLPENTRPYDIAKPNRLVPSVRHTTANLYLEDSDGFEAAGLKALVGLDLAKERWFLKNSAAEDHAAALKLLPGPNAATDWASLRLYPTLRYTSNSHKGGVGTTASPAWPSGVTAPLLDDFDAPPAPNTRDGIRLRRLVETAGNRAAFSPAAHLDHPPVSHRNPLAEFAARHPFDNATPQEPGGSSGIRRQEYFGVFTRDAFDPDADFAAFAPVGAVSAAPFHRPAEAPALTRVVVATTPGAPAEIASVVDFVTAPLSPWSWQPLRTVGESGVEPDVPADRTAHGAAEENWPGMGVGAKHYLDWIRHAEAPDEPRIYDARYELNHALFDRYAHITGDEETRARFAAGSGTPPNSRMRRAPDVSDLSIRITGADAESRAAGAVVVAGMFNVNSVSETAWRAVLASAAGYAPDGGPGDPARTPFPDGPHRGPAMSGPAEDHRTENFWNAPRGLTQEEIATLAREIVAEIRRRGPALSLADFVNRELVDAPVETGAENFSTNAGGRLAAAIARAGLNPIPPALAVPKNHALPGTRHLAAHESPDKGEGVASRLSQAHLLRALAPVMSTRSDTFLVRVEACDASGAHVRLEAEVSRTPTPVVAHPENPDEPSPTTAAFLGRRLVVTSVREISR